ncbi:MAG: histidinol-phosphatase [Bacteroidales bacterium]|nr:histidinol-phosphatase [Bacteroidales bacterium]
MTGNLHTHTNFSDGTAPPEAYIEEAKRLGFSVLGFSDHSPVPFPNTFAIPEGGLGGYVTAIQKLASQQSAVGSLQSSSIPDPSSGIWHLATDIEILLGLEYDYIPGLTTPLKKLREDYVFDYVIGSVHLVRNHRPDLLWFIDGPQSKTYDKGIREVFGGDSKKAITAYWRQLQEMVIVEEPDIIGHLDKIKMHNHDRYFREDEPWYLVLAEETLELIREKNAVVEVNTRGIYKQRSESLFPGPELLKIIHARNIPITLASDAHHPDELSLFFPETKQLLKDVGFRYTWLLTTEGWKESAL